MDLKTETWALCYGDPAGFFVVDHHALSLTNCNGLGWTRMKSFRARRFRGPSVLCSFVLALGQLVLRV